MHTVWSIQIALTPRRTVNAVKSDTNRVTATATTTSRTTRLTTTEEKENLLAINLLHTKVHLLDTNKPIKSNMLFKHFERIKSVFYR